MSFNVMRNIVMKDQKERLVAAVMESKIFSFPSDINWPYLPPIIDSTFLINLL